MGNLQSGKYNNNLIGGETLLLSRDIRDKLGMPYDENMLLDFFIGGRGYDKGKARLKKTEQTEFHWWEHDYLVGRVTIASKTGTAAAGNPVTVTINALSDKSNPFIVNDLVMIGGIQGWISAVTENTGTGAHQYVVQTVDNTTDIVTAAVASGYMVWYGNAFADGSALPASKVRKPVRYSNDTQIFQTLYEAYGSEAASMSEPVVDKGERYYYRQGVVDLLLRHRASIEFSMIMGRRAVGLNDPNHADSTATVKTTAGLEYLVDTYGQTESNASFAYAQMQNIEKKANKAMAPKEFFGFVGHTLKLDIDSALLDKNVNTGISYAAFGEGDNKKRAIDFSFDSYRVGARTYHIKSWTALSYDRVTGENGYDMADMGFFLPNNVITSEGKKYDSICLRFKSSPQEKRFMIDEYRSPKITGKDAHQFTAKSELGLMACNLVQYIKYETV